MSVQEEATAPQPPKPAKPPKPLQPRLKTRRTKVNMGRAMLAIRWQNIYRRTVTNTRDTITIEVDNSYPYALGSPAAAPWNAAFVMPGRLNSKFTSIMTRAYSKTKRLTTVIDNKGQKHQLHHSIPPGSSPESLSFTLPPKFYQKRKPVIVTAIYDTITRVLTDGNRIQIINNTMNRAPATKRGSDDDEDDHKPKKVCVPEAALAAAEVAAN